jgi:hypothetical protein
MSSGQGHRVGVDTVGDLPWEEMFSMLANAKAIEGQQPPRLAAR